MHPSANTSVAGFGLRGLNLLRCQIAHRPEDHAGLGRNHLGVHDLSPRREPSARASCDSEVQHFHASGASDKDVLGFEIAMDDPAGMCGSDAVGDFHHQLECLNRTEMFPAESGTESLSFEELGHRVVDAVLAADVEDRQDVRMGKRRDRARLAPESLERGLVSGEMRRKNLDRDVAIQPRVLGPINLPHAADRDEVENRVRAEGFPRSEQTGSPTVRYDRSNRLRRFIGASINDVPDSAATPVRKGPSPIDAGRGPDVEGGRALWPSGSRARSRSGTALAEEFDRRLECIELRFLIGRELRGELAVGGLAGRIDLATDRADLQHQRSDRCRVASLEGRVELVGERALLIVKRLQRSAEIRLDRLPSRPLIGGEGQVLGQRLRVAAHLRSARRWRWGVALRPGRIHALRADDEKQNCDCGKNSFHRLAPLVLSFPTERIASSGREATKASPHRKVYVRNVKPRRCAGSGAESGVRLAASMRIPRGSNALLALLLILLVGGLAVLATLQYRWIDRVSDAERQRMQANLDFSARRFADELRREIEPLIAPFDVADGADLPSRFADWSRTAEHPRLVEAVDLATPDRGSWALQVIDPETGGLVDTQWPSALEILHRRLVERPGRRQPRPGAFVSEIPALFIPHRNGPPGSPADREPPPPDGGPPRPDGEAPPPFGGRPPPRPTHAVIIVLSRDELANRILPDLASRHFSGGSGGYDVAVKIGEDLLFRSDPSWPDGKTAADLVFPFVPVPPRAERERPPGLDRPRQPPSEEAVTSWSLLLRRRDGGLDSIVSAARRRNLAISFAILAILGGTMFLLLYLFRRADRLRAQQTEFVAAISHELNTPVAALRAAGENLKDGIVTDRARLARYGETIVKEAARLGEMIGQVLEFAGLQARPGRKADDAVVVDQVVEEAVGQCHWLLDGTAIRIETDVEKDLPAIAGDGDALTRALQNLVANAIRHGGAGNWIGVRAKRAGGGVAITVEDRGPGIDGRDAIHLFEPFYRGRATSARGTGLGLTIVKQIVVAHGGTIEIDRRRRGGAAFTIHLPEARHA